MRLNGIRTSDPSNRGSTDLCINPYDHSDRHIRSMYRAEGRLQVVNANVNIEEAIHLNSIHESTGQEI